MYLFTCQALLSNFAAASAWDMYGVDRPRKFGTRYLNSLASTKRGFDTYYEGREIAYALQVTDVWEYENPVDLNKLRNRFSNFSVPQSWRYVKPEEYRSFRNMKREIKEEVFNG